MIDLSLAKGSIILQELLARVLTKQPDEFPLYIIKRLLQTAEFAEWALPSSDNQLLLDAMVEREGEDSEQSRIGELEPCNMRAETHRGWLCTEPPGRNNPPRRSGKRVHSRR